MACCATPEGFPIWRRPEQTTQPAFKRHVGVIGLLFASVGSIIGSGWLFGALNASIAAGPAAVISWALGGFLILLIALVYAELGTMCPPVGWCGALPAHGLRAPGQLHLWLDHLRRGGHHRADRGRGKLQYGTKYAPFTTEHTVNGETVHTLTALGYGAAVILMAVFVVVNYYGVRWFARINNVLVW